MAGCPLTLFSAEHASGKFGEFPRLTTVVFREPPTVELIGYGLRSPVTGAARPNACGDMQIGKSHLIIRPRTSN